MNDVTAERIHKELIDDGLIHERKELDGSTTCSFNMKIFVDMAEKLGEIPLSIKLYKKISNHKKNVHPRDVQNNIAIILANSCVYYIECNKSIDLMGSEDIKAKNQDDVLLYTALIKKIYNLTPYKKEGVFYWFRPDENELEDIKRIANSQASLFGSQ